VSGQPPLSTCWTLIDGAAAGAGRDRDEFARRYVPVVRAYLAARWRGGPHVADVEDAVQEVFVECFKPGGVLERAEPSRDGGFRSFLYGVVRHVAQRFEVRRAREDRRQGEADLAAVAAAEESLSRVFDRAWARALLREAARLQAEHAARTGPEALRRVELLRLRFEDGLPIREIARRWQVDAARLHHDYARARQEFKEALTQLLAFHHPGASPEELERECLGLLALLG
jgi:RNA polymerase sigma-70 factor (ECF subfamily)